SPGSANEPTKRGTSRTPGIRPRSTCTRRSASSRLPATSRFPTPRSRAAKGSCSGWTWPRTIRPSQAPNQTPAPDPAWDQAPPIALRLGRADLDQAGEGGVDRHVVVAPLGVDHERVRPDVRVADLDERREAADVDGDGDRVGGEVGL